MTRLGPSAAGPEDLLRPVFRALAPVHDIAFRGSPVEAWIKSRRDMYPTTSPGWQVLDSLLDDWRERADTGTFLSDEGDEGLYHGILRGQVQIDYDPDEVFTPVTLVPLEEEGQ